MGRQTEYHHKLHRERRFFAITLLGGKCVKCGAIEQLEIDHIDPRTKIKQLQYFTSLSKFVKELALCQLLCKPCHIDKTRKEKGVEHGGGVRGKRNCMCELCIAARQRYNEKRSAARGHVVFNWRPCSWSANYATFNTTVVYIHCDRVAACR